MASASSAASTTLYSQAYGETTMQQELKIQFFDSSWLGRYSLHSEEMAMEYFYTSPFYLGHREGTLNESIRAGETVEPEQDGLLYEVTYSNLASILPNAPGSYEARHIYFNEMAIFHIKLYRRKTGLRGLIATPLKVYCILQGKIYRIPSLSDVCWYRMFNSTRQIEKCFDEIQSMSEWNLMEGYFWTAGKSSAETERLVATCKEFTLMKATDEKSNSNTDSTHRDSTKAIANVPEALEVFYTKGTGKLALQICQAEIKELQQLRRRVATESEGVDAELSALKVPSNG